MSPPPPLIRSAHDPPITSCPITSGHQCSSSQEQILQALCGWWDVVGNAMPPDKAPYAPKYQVVCKETIQKLLFAWLRNGVNGKACLLASALSYQEFSSRLGEPTLWSKWWMLKIEPKCGQSWGRGQWCRLYRLHQALPPFVRFKCVSTDTNPIMASSFSSFKSIDTYFFA